MPRTAEKCHLGNKDQHIPNSTLHLLLLFVTPQYKGSLLYIPAPDIAHSQSGPTHMTQTSLQLPREQLGMMLYSNTSPSRQEQAIQTKNLYIGGMLARLKRG